MAMAVTGMAITDMVPSFFGLRRHHDAAKTRLHYTLKTSERGNSLWLLAVRSSLQRVRRGPGLRISGHYTHLQS
jgi:hypothetical protein